MTHLEENPFDKFDRYDLRHYLEHLRDGRRGDEVHRVLWQEYRLAEAVGSRSWLKRIFIAGRTPEDATLFRNCWYAVQEKIGEIHNFVKDVGICWNVAEIESKKVLGEGRTASGIGLEVRYALIEEKILTVEQSLAYVAQIPDAPQRALATVLVARHADDADRAGLFEQSFDILRSMRDDIALAKTLVRIA